MAGTYTKLYYHIVFSTKNRKPLINQTIEIELHKYIIPYPSATSREPALK